MSGESRDTYARFEMRIPTDERLTQEELKEIMINAIDQKLRSREGNDERDTDVFKIKVVPLTRRESLTSKSGSTDSESVLRRNLTRTKSQHVLNGPLLSLTNPIIPNGLVVILRDLFNRFVVVWENQLFLLVNELLLVRKS